MSLDYEDALDQGMSVILNDILSEFVREEEKAMTDSAAKARQDYQDARKALVHEWWSAYQDCDAPLADDFWREQIGNAEAAVDAAVLALMVEAVSLVRVSSSHGPEGARIRVTRPSEEQLQALLKGEEPKKP